MLDVVPEVGSERHVVQRWHMPGPERDDERDRRDARSVRMPVSHRTGPVASAEATARRAGSGSPLSSGATGAPSQSSGGATTISSRCWTMCAWSHRWPSASIGEQSARNMMLSPAANATGRRAPKCLGTRGRSAAQRREARRP